MRKLLSSIFNIHEKLPYPKAMFIFDGIAYKWSGWFGCQLESFEWKTVPAGTTRTLSFSDGGDPITITVFYTSKRSRFKVRTTWSISSSGTLEEHNNRIKDLQYRLSKLI